VRFLGTAATQVPNCSTGPTEPQVTSAASPPLVQELNQHRTHPVPSGGGASHLAGDSKPLVHMHSRRGISNVLDHTDLHMALLSLGSCPLQILWRLHPSPSLHLLRRHDTTDWQCSLCTQSAWRVAGNARHPERRRPFGPRSSVQTLMAYTSTMSYMVGSHLGRTSGGAQGEPIIALRYQKG
jgi:hypothetical protein